MGNGTDSASGGSVQVRLLGCEFPRTFARAQNEHEYELHPISLPPNLAYSPASIGKAYLRAMGIVEPMRKFKDMPPKIQGIAMAAYYGGRAECHIRRWPVPVVPVDLTSEYPSVDALLGIWDVLTAARLTTEDAKKDVRALLANVTLDDLFRPAFWKQLNFYARIIPEGDIPAGTLRIRPQVRHLQHRLKRT